MESISDQAIIVAISALAALLGRQGIVSTIFAARKKSAEAIRAADHDAMIEARQWYGDTLEAMRGELDRFQSSVRELSDENAILRIQVGKLNSENASLKIEMEEFKRENKKLRGEISKLRKELSELKGDNK